MRQAALALDAVSSFRVRGSFCEAIAREQLADDLLAAWRNGRGLDPALVLRAVEVAAERVASQRPQRF